MLRSSLLFSIFKIVALFALASLLSTQLTACSSLNVKPWKQVPIQMARVSQTESYTQTFLLGNLRGSDGEELSLKQRLALDMKMDLVFRKLIGSKNWQHLKNLYGVSSMRNELIQGDVYMQGLINFTTYLDPTNSRYVIMEGIGRFFAIRKKTGAILISGDFHITPQRYKISDFSKSCIPLEANIYTTRIPGQPTFYKNSVVRYDLMINNPTKDEDVFAIDYQRNHLAYIDLNGDGNYEKSEVFASLKMASRHNQAKLVDLNGLTFIKQYNMRNDIAHEADEQAEIDRQKRCIQGGA